ncbi:MAG TPA: hypothetical protein VM692_02590, partial [Gammaproteobacteria bacterium]|nr:hypothetical protein [Gammaproteobacteria bacterium]
MAYAIAMLGLVARADAATPLEAYGALPTVENIVISPDGTRLAFVRTQGEERFVAVVSLATGETLAGARAGDVKLRSIEWAGDGHVLMVGSVTKDVTWLSGGKTEWSLLSVLDVGANTVTAVPKQGADNPNIISDVPMVREIDGRVVLFVPGAHLRDYLLPALYRYDVESGAQTLLERGLRSTRQWFVDDRGNIVARIHYDDAVSSWTIEARQSGGQYRVVEQGFSTVYEPRILGYGFDHDSMLVSYPSNDSWKWALVPLRDEEPDLG